jgi:cell division septum initiation protein DivIVA
MSTPETLTRELAALDDALAGRPVDPDLAGLAELAILVRDERPAPDPAFANSLDERARRGFPRTAKRRAFAWPKFTLPALGLAASVFLVVVIATSIPSGGGSGDEAGSSGAGGGGSASSQAAPNTDEAAPPASDESAARKQADSAGGAATSTPALAAPSAPHRYVERSAQITLATTPRDIDGAAAKVIRVADDLGGYVASSQITSGEGGTFELRVPERRLQRALERLSAIGKVRNRTQAAQDITGSVVSVRSRLKDARTERESLLKQLAKATTTNETTSIRARLRIVSRQIAAAKDDLKSVKRRASTSSVSVTLEADKDAGGAAGGDGKWSPGDALKDAGRVLEVTASVLLVAGAVALPLGLVVLLIWFATRQASHRRRERALDAV